MRYTKVINRYISSFKKISRVSYLLADSQISRPTNLGWVLGNSLDGIQQQSEMTKWTLIRIHWFMCCMIIYPSYHSRLFNRNSWLLTLRLRATKNSLMSLIAVCFWRRDISMIIDDPEHTVKANECVGRIVLIHSYLFQINPPEKEVFLSLLSQ